jgi:glycosyltransferase involved in cell wall biosynthesis
MKFLFSIIIPVYNVELYIEKCLLSCLKQEYVSVGDYEIIIVNDGTKDNSIVLAKKIIQNYPEHHIKFIERENGGLSAARNTGLTHVDGKYVWFVDSDDWIVSDALACLKQKIEINKNSEIITFTHLTAYEDGTFSKEVLGGTDYVSSGFDYLANNNFLSSCTCIYATHFLKENNFIFKEGMLWEDSEFNLRAYSLVKNHYFYNKPLYYYLRRASSITTNGTSYKMVNSWFIKIDSVYSYFKDKKLSPSESNIINYHLASTIVAAIAGLPDLPQKERSEFEQKIKNQKKYYWQFFSNSKDFKMKFSGLLILLSLPLAEVLFRFIVKRAIKKGEGK